MDSFDQTVQENYYYSYANRTLKPTSGEVLIMEKSYKDYELEIKET